MNTMKSFMYFGEVVQTVEKNGVRWFRGKDIATLLGYSKPTKAITDHVKSVERNYLKNLFTELESSNLKYHVKNAIWISTNGLTQLLCKCVLPNKTDFVEWCCEKFDIDINTHTFLRKEQDTIGSIQRAFPLQTHERQFSIGDYKIDLYFPDAKVAIECDEYDHKDRNSEYELDRRRFIEQQLGCVFVRYNPDDPDFDIFNVIGRIIFAVYGS